MNLILNNYCNLKCQYCFAHDFISEKSQSMTLENYNKILDFQEKCNITQVRLAGGEPTLHPQFTEFFIEALNRPFVKNIHIFSNATFSDKIANLLISASRQPDKKISLLLNYNHPDILGKERNERFLRNLQLLSKSSISINLSINLFQENQDYQYLIETAVKFKIKSIRWSLVVPNTNTTRELNVAEYFLKHSPLIVDFIRDTTIAGLEPHTDCNNIPLCLLSDDQLRLIAMIGERNLRTSVCTPVIDVRPDMTVARCFAMDRHSIPLDNFNSVGEMIEYFVEKIDNEINNKMLFDECVNCASYQLRGKSCACLAFQNR